MKYQRLPLTTLLLGAGMAVCPPLHADNHPTRGIGVYPGNPSQTFHPKKTTAKTAGNVALLCTATASSSFDYNLTAQLATDGILAKGMPAQLTVSTKEGPLNLREKEKTLDENWVTYNQVMGNNNYLQYDWTGMSVAPKAIHFAGSVIYHPDRQKGYRYSVQASTDGTTWQTIGEVKGDSLPGTPSKERASSDPNKQEDTGVLPVRKIDQTINITAGTYQHLRLVLDVPSAAYSRIETVDFEGADKPLPSWHFDSAWRSAISKDDQWLMVDLGAATPIDSTLIDWIGSPKTFYVETSNDGRSWTVANVYHEPMLLSTGATTDVIVSTPLMTKGTCRYVRVYIPSMGREAAYTISELRVFGQKQFAYMPCGEEGFHGHNSAASTRDTKDNYSLNGGNWQLQRVGDTQWIPATVPATVLTSYYNVGAVPDNTFGDNMKQISESYFNSDFRYRKTFDLPKEMAGRHIFLNFDGINWKADVTLNGHKLGRIDGAFLRGQYDITPYVKETGNELEVYIHHNAHPGVIKTKNEETTDFNGGALGADNPTFHATIGWDWITTTPGRNIGIWNDVFLTANEGVLVKDPLVTTTLSKDLKASMTPSVLLKNTTDKTTDVMVKGWIGKITFKKKVSLQPQSVEEVSFTPDEYKQLKNQTMHLWWPNGYGDPYLYDAGFAIEQNGKTTGEVTYKAGIREMSYKDKTTDLKIYINHKRFNPLGGNWGFSETNLNYRDREYDIAVRYHRDMHCTMIRDWVGMIGDEEFYEACDRYGLMVWQDFWLANPWDGPDPDDEQMFMENARDYVYRIRRHPSLGIYVGRNEGYPPATLNKALPEMLATEHPQLEYIPSSADDGVSGHGPYNALPAKEYFANQTGKLHSERGMPAVMNRESMLRMLPADSVDHYNIGWAQHDFTLKGAQKGASFMQMIADRFGNDDKSGRTTGYGMDTKAGRFQDLAQWINYDGYRAMFEASQQQRKGLLIWMSHPCWPSQVWQTYDYYFEPTAALFGTQKACEPIHVQYNADKNTVELVSYVRPYKKVEVKAAVLDYQGNTLSEQTHRVNISGDETLTIGNPLTLPGDSCYYIKLTATQDGKTLSDNFYVEQSVKQGMRQLLQLPKVHLMKVVESITPAAGNDHSADDQTLRVTLANDTDTPALMIRLNLKNDHGDQILPAFYSDNYFALMPHESKTVTVTWHKADMHGSEAVIKVSGFNVTE